MIDPATLSPEAHKVVCGLLGLDPSKPFSVSQSEPERREGKTVIRGEAKVFWP